MIRRSSMGGLLLAGLAAFGAYKYSKMSEDEKRRLMDKGKRLVNDNLGNLKNTLGGQRANMSGTGSGMTQGV
ncbi:MAG TPA: hypothetical protein VGE66_19315 [Chitinophagaceae bacterium]